MTKISFRREFLKQLDKSIFWSDGALSFRRDADGIPMVRKHQDILLPRLAGARLDGSRNTTSSRRTMHEARRRTQRRQVPLQLVHSGEQVHGVIALDMTTGSLNSLQAKSIIIADGGYEGI